MTHATVIDKYDVAGTQRVIEATVTISSYTSGGEDLSDLTDVLGAVSKAFFQAAGSTGYMFCWDKDNEKVIVMVATDTEETATNYVGAVDVRMTGV